MKERTLKCRHGSRAAESRGPFSGGERGEAVMEYVIIAMLIAALCAAAGIMAAKTLAGRPGHRNAPAGARTKHAAKPSGTAGVPGPAPRRGLPPRN